MSSWLSPSRAAAQRDRSVSNGGLGGLVDLGRNERPGAMHGKWKEKKRPAPLKMFTSDGLLASWTPLFSSASRATTNARSPVSPLSLFTDGETAAAQNISPQACCSATSRCAICLSRKLQPYSPATRVKAAQSPGPPPYELPGSLLLPSQGFTPPPSTPTKLVRRPTDESDLSSPPSLTTCDTTSSGGSSNMGFWKGKNAHEGASSLGSDAWRSSNDHNDKLMSVTSTISKPFTRMSIDELLDALPGCNQAAIKELWIPEMRKKIAAAKIVYQTAELRSFHSHESLVVMEGVSPGSLLNRAYYTDMLFEGSCGHRKPSEATDTVVRPSHQIC